MPDNTNPFTKVKKYFLGIDHGCDKDSIDTHFKAADPVHTCR